MSTDARLTEVFESALEIPFDDFIEDLELDRKYVVSNFHIWSEKFNIKRKGNLIIKK